MEEKNKNPRSENQPAEVVDIQFRPGQKVYYFGANGIRCKAGDHVIIDTARGPEYGYCTAGNHHIPQKEIVTPLRPVLRIATAQDEKIARENQEKERLAFQVCSEKIREQGLDMQLVNAECTFDGSKLLFFFTADDRVDFRELVKNLASTFHTRIELRQIGVRDKAKMVGGLGICGRPFCCATFLDDFQPVSIKMAKTQNLSLNPTKISGTCGRLMCCLNYEQAAYEDLIKNSPKAESFVDTPDGRGTVAEVDLLRQRVKVRMEHQPEIISTYSNADIAVFRNGKAKKTDPPIPEDWAPISGSKKRVKRDQPDGDRMFLDPIKFRYSEEAVVEEAQEQAQEVQTSEQAEEKGNRSRRRNRKPKGNAQKPEQQPKADAKPSPEAKEKAAPKPQAEGQTDANKKRRRNYHRRKPKGNAQKPANPQ